jgi:thioesterase domain-containing protein
MGKKYEPEGSVKRIDVFYCTPLHSVCLTREQWVSDQLAKWQDFSREPVGFVECEGDHADMLNAAYVEGFEVRLNKILAERGL